jgi:hypothetical protein
MQAFLKRTAYCALAILGVIFAIGLIEAVRSTLPESLHTIFDWVSTIAQTVLAAVLMGAFVSLWLGFDDIKWPEPIKHMLAKFEEAQKYAPNWGRPHMKWGEVLGYAGKKDEA